MTPEINSLASGLLDPPSILKSCMNTEHRKSRYSRVKMTSVCKIKIYDDEAGVEARTISSRAAPGGLMLGAPQMHKMPLINQRNVSSLITPT